MRFFYLIFCLLVTGCSARIHLSATVEPDRQYLIFQLENADLYFLKEDVLAYAQTVEAKKSLTINQNEYDLILDRVRNIRSDTLAFSIKRDDRDGSVRSNAHLLLSLSYVDLISHKRFMVYNKSACAYESIVYVKKVKSKNGIRMSYLFHDGREFYYDIISTND